MTVSSLAARLVVRISGVGFLHEVHGVRPLAAVAVAAAYSVEIGGRMKVNV